MNYESFRKKSRVKIGPPNLGAVMHRYDNTDGKVDYQYICITDTVIKQSREGVRVGECKKQRTTRMRRRMVEKIGEFKGHKLEWPPENKLCYI